MPLYDFRCADCTAEREVRVSFETADHVTLVCTTCGGIMSKAISRTVAFLTGTSKAESPAPSRSRNATKRSRTCSDGVVKLTRANPFAPVLPVHPDGGREEG